MSDSPPRSLTRSGMLPLPVPLLLLAGAHLPFVALQCQRLWGLEYYQFFPFAFGLFGWLFYKRRLVGVFHWDYANSAIVAMDVALLAIGTWRNSPWTVYIGALLLCLAVCRACRDAEYDCSLTYLFLLPVITLRPPLMYDELIIHWLQTVTTRVASLLLNFFGFLHLRQGNILEFPGKRFLVEEACSGVQSLFTVLFLASVIICGYRRRWMHAIAILASGFAIAGFMNVLRICAISVAWSESGIDLSTGWQHEALGHVALTAAALLVFSADALMEFFFEFVPDTRGGGVSFLFRNPLIVFWNYLFGRRRRHRDADQRSTMIDKPALRIGAETALVAAAALICVSAVALQLKAM